jgi:hypothetical protein
MAWLHLSSWTVFVFNTLRILLWQAAGWTSMLATDALIAKSAEDCQTDVCMDRQTVGLHPPYWSSLHIMQRVRYSYSTSILLNRSVTSWSYAQSDIATSNTCVHSESLSTSSILPWWGVTIAFNRYKLIDINYFDGTVNTGPFFVHSINSVGYWHLLILSHQLFLLFR